MKAAILSRLHHPLIIAEVNPQELTFGQVLVNIQASGICGAQLQEIDGEKGDLKHIPHLLGHEGVGIVEHVGPGVRKVKVGDKVVLHWRKGDGIESEFPSYESGAGMIKGGLVTTFSEQSVVSENRLTPVPRDTPDELCALLGCGLSTALATIELEANVKFGESVLILGCGGLGMNLILAAKLAHAHPIVSADIRDKKETALSLGANVFLCTQDVTLKNYLGDRGQFDVIIDTTGNASVIEQSIPLLNGSGRYIFVGQPKPATSLNLTNARHIFEGEGKTLKATQGGRFNPTRDIPRYIQMHQAGLLNLNGIISHRFPLDRINEGIGLVRRGNAGRILIEMK